MNFDRANSNSKMTLHELYDVLSSEATRDAQFVTGVLLFLWTPNFKSFQCKRCANERGAYVLAAGGYTLHDAGDAILAEWVDEDVEISETISKAIQCTFKLLNACKHQMRAHGFIIPPTIAISAGRFSRVRLGDGDSEVCVVTGPAVDEIRSAEPLAEDGDIILSAEAWKLCNRENLTVEHIGDEEAVKLRHISQQNITLELLTPSDFDSLMTGYPRKAYLLSTEDRGNIINEFMMDRVVKRIHDNKQRKDLPKIWPVTVMFINLLFVQTETELRDSHLKASEIIADEMLHCGGRICNVFFFDEGITFLCLVGLSGDETQDKIAHTLQSAFWIHETCQREIDSLWSISVGVSTGRVFYGPESLRNEYKVYGPAVRLAAELMMDSPGTVSCDVTTKLYSTLPPSRFMPRVEISTHEAVRNRDEIMLILNDETAWSSGETESRRLALAHLQIMTLEEIKVVQHASAIGHTFSTHMLKEIMPHLSEVELISILRSLVRAGIFKCASITGDVSSAKTCDCEKNSREHTQVITCQLMSSCNNDEMEIMHKLLQKIMHVLRAIHTKCARYLEKKSYRCSKCGPEKFILRHKASADNSNERLQEIYDTIRPYEIFRSQGVTCKNEMNPAKENGNETENFLAKVQSLLTEVSDRTTAGGSCECAQLVETVLIPRMRHWKWAGDVSRTFDHLLEAAAAHIFFQNDAKALEYLSEARSILDNIKEGDLAYPFARYSDVEISELQQVRMHRLTGEILFQVGKILEAEENFKAALTLLKCDLPESTVAQSMKRMHEKMKKRRYRSRQFTIPEKSKLVRLQESIRCLSFLWQISHVRGQLKRASLAITMEINLAMRSADPFMILHSAIDYLKYNQFKGKESKCRRLEAFLCRTCASLSDHPEGQGLIIHLTQTLAVVKMCQGDLKQSIMYTMRAQQLSEVLKRPGLDVRTTFALHLPLLLTERHRESVQQILALEKLSNEMSSIVAKGWFYAACLNLLLYAGFELRPFEECLAFVEQSQSDADLKADKSLVLHLYSAMALWFARLENWRFKVFFDKACKMFAEAPTSIESLSGAVMLLECRALLYKKELTGYNSRRRSTLKRTEKLFSDVRERFGTNHIFTPRVLLLNAFLHQLNGDETLALALLDEAMLLCKKRGDLLDKAWIRQSQDDWLSGSCGDAPPEWSTTVLSMPSWEEAATLQPEQLLRNRFHLRVVEVILRSHTLGRRRWLFSNT